MDNYFIVHNKVKYLAGREAGIFHFTDKQMEDAEKSEDGLLSTENGVDLYLSTYITTEDKEGGK